MSNEHQQYSTKALKKDYWKHVKSYWRISAKIARRERNLPRAMFPASERVYIGRLVGDLSAERGVIRQCVEELKHRGEWYEV